MFRRLSQWTLDWSRSRHAEWALGAVSFAESSFFMIPAEVIFVPMCLTRPERALRYGVIAAVMSVLGGIFGWCIGYFAFDLIARPVLTFYNGMDAFERLKQATGNGTILLMLITSGLAHIPPMKVVTILAGALSFNLPLFILAAIIARAAKFMALGWALKTYGPALAAVIQRRLATFAVVAIMAGAVLWLAFQFIRG
ncbi:MAG: YqaA family protein [Alphaproteobacteria bacterium]